MQVVMRIRPPLQHGMPSWSKENCIHAVSGSTVAIAPPENSQGYKNGDRGQTYNFTRVFSEHTGQEEYFQSTAAPLVGLCCFCAIAYVPNEGSAALQSNTRISSERGACLTADLKHLHCAGVIQSNTGQVACISVYPCCTRNQESIFMLSAYPNA